MRPDACVQGSCGGLTDLTCSGCGQGNTSLFRVSQQAFLLMAGRCIVASWHVVQNHSNIPAEHEGCESSWGLIGIQHVEEWYEMAACMQLYQVLTCSACT